MGPPHALPRICQAPSQSISRLSESCAGASQLVPTTMQPASTGNAPPRQLLWRGDWTDLCALLCTSKGISFPLCASRCGCGSVLSLPSLRRILDQLVHLNIRFRVARCFPSFGVSNEKPSVKLIYATDFASTFPGTCLSNHRKRTFKP